jgi:signal peptidase I
MGAESGKRIEMAAEEEKKETSPARKRFETTRALLLAVLIALAIRSFVIEPFTIPSGSMIPTLLVGDYVLVNKFSYGIRLPIKGTLLVPFGKPDRGDVIVFRYPDDPRQDFIKRVVGLPGDRIEIRKGRLWINGQPVDEVSEGEFVYVDLEHDRTVRAQRFEERFEETGGHTILRMERNGRAPRRGPWIVPEGEYFTMGDNRDNSKDSRFWRRNFVRADQIKGKAEWIHWSWIVNRGGRQDRGLFLGLLDTIYRVVTFQVEEIRWSRLGRDIDGPAS